MPPRKKNKANAEFKPAMRKGRIEQLTIYEISDSELEVLSKGSPDSLFLNFAIFLLSIAVSFTIALSTVTISSNKTFIVFVIITTVGYMGGLFLLLLWFRNCRTTSDIVKTIKKRLPPEGVQEGPKIVDKT